MRNLNYHKRKQNRIARLNRLRNRPRRRRNENPSYRYLLRNERESLRRQIFREFNFTGEESTYVVSGNVGIEKLSEIDAFIELARNSIGSNTANLVLDLRSSTRIWPSAIALLCSFIKWLELASRVNGVKPPSVSSYSAEDPFVENYLVFSGFYDYVHRVHGPQDIEYDRSRIVKLRRELKKSVLTERHNEIVDLLAKNSAMTPYQRELFSDVVLVEIANNVIEHGFTTKDLGWYILAQCHPRTGIISICIADNGIGIRNTLTTGPQKEEIEKQFPNTKDHDLEHIKLALTEVVSGAVDATTKDDGTFRKRLPRGANRGNGLKRVRLACIKCGVRLSVFSHFGYVCFDEQGNILREGNSDTRVFAGTLYHMVIPFQGGGNESN